MKQPCDHSPVIRFFAICHTSDVDLKTALPAAGTINEAASSFGPAADSLWDAICAAILGEYEAVRRFGIDMTDITDSLRNASTSLRVQLRLQAIVGQLQKLTGAGDWHPF